MFYGRYYHNIDKKGRMTVPATFRDETPSGIVFITKGFDGNLMGLTEEGFKAFAQNLSAVSITDPDGRSIAREIFGNTAELTYDSAGRILIPLNLRKLVGIEEEVVIVGAGSNFEIWSKDKLEEHEAKNNDPEAQAMAWRGINIPLIRGI